MNSHPRLVTAIGVHRVEITITVAITVKDDATLERGDYVVDTAQTHLDGRVASQVDTIGRVLFDE